MPGDASITMGLAVWNCSYRKSDSPKMIKIHHFDLLSSAENWFSVDSEKWILQEDIDPKYRSRLCQEWKATNDMEMMDCPSHSPDANPIENFWKTCLFTDTAVSQDQVVSYKSDGKHAENMPAYYRQQRGQGAFLGKCVVLLEAYFPIQEELIFLISSFRKTSTHSCWTLKF